MKLINVQQSSVFKTYNYLHYYEYRSKNGERNKQKSEEY